MMWPRILLLVQFGVVCVVLGSLPMIVGCDKTSRDREVSQPTDYFFSTYEHEGCEFLAIKEKKGDKWETVSVIHHHKCKNCLKNPVGRENE